MIDIAYVLLVRDACAPAGSSFLNMCTKNQFNIEAHCVEYKLLLKP